MIPTVLFLRSLILTLHSYIHKSSGKSGNITIFLYYCPLKLFDSTKN